jgi:hypothetical protein
MQKELSNHNQGELLVKFESLENGMKVELGI